MPTSTPAFQMAAMYGVQPDIPGFHYHDKRRRADIHFPRAGHAAGVEAAHVAGRVGILRGGSVYGCVFTGGAENDLFSFAKLTRPSGPGVVRVLSGFVVLGWVALKGVCQTIGVLLRSWCVAWCIPRGAGRRWQWTKIKVGVSVWVRQFFTAEVARDLYDGVPVDLRELPRLRRRRPRVRTPGPRGLPRARVRGPIDPSDRSDPAASPRAPVRPLRPVRSRPGAVEAVRRADGRQAVRAPALRRAPGCPRHLERHPAPKDRPRRVRPWLHGLPHRAEGVGPARHEPDRPASPRRAPTSGKRTSAAVFG